MAAGTPALAGARSGARVHEVRTPEGLVLPFRVGSAGDRLGAFLVDLALMAAILAGVLLVFVFALMAGGGAWSGAIALLATFAVFNGYFLWFELRPGAATPGKRWAGLRVMDAEGGVLSPDAVLARNLMRNLELTVPLGLLLAPDALGAAVPWWGRLLSLVWVFAVAGLPLFHRLRLRPGDMVGGTIVVGAPRRVLLEDLAAARRARRAEAAAPRHAFTEAHRAVYGIYELQVLEDVLRQDAPDGRRTEHAVAERIAAKIGWGAPVDRASARTFLLEYYAALRARLERRALFGKRKRDKFSREA
jgi:uncharacterized RDD family membrane protein YckC